MKFNWTERNNFSYIFPGPLLLTYTVLMGLGHLKKTWDKISTIYLTYIFPAGDDKMNVLVYQKNLWTTIQPQVNNLI